MKVSPKYDFNILSFCSKYSKINGTFGFCFVAATMNIFWCLIYINDTPSTNIAGGVDPVDFCAMI